MLKKKIEECWSKIKVVGIFGTSVHGFDEVHCILCEVNALKVIENKRD